ncbi:hypothetical protein [Nocardioides caldifontis]|uniref:hypothetical protein n=1 Tax=Nocardioides caldifontis TaxID=2588938 RepID=UPI0011E06AED|nr:hypothetical protein [Nocardioides caldifontis]
MTGSPLRARLRTRLTAALRERDKEVAASLRSTLAALENAEAVAAPTTGALAAGEHVAGAAVGIGSSEAPRRTLTEDDEREVVARELADLHAAATSYDAVGAVDRADGLRRAAAAVTAVLEEEPC